MKIMCFNLSYNLIMVLLVSQYPRQLPIKLANLKIQIITNFGFFKCIIYLYIYI